MSLLPFSTDQDISLDAETQTRGDILVVDDSLVSIELLTAMLAAEGYTLRSAADGLTALTAIQEKSPDLVLMDVFMAGMDGYETCRQMRSQPATGNIPVIFMSAADGEFDKVRGFEVGGADYITKPLKLHEVMARIEHQLHLKRLQRELERKNQQLSAEIEHRIQVEETLRQQAQQERLRAMITERIRQSLHLNDILDAAVAELRPVLKVDRMLIMRFNPNWSGLIVAESFTTQDRRSIGWTIRDPRFQEWWVAPDRINQTIQVNDLHQHPTEIGYVSLFESLKARALVIVPIVQGLHVWGLLMAHHNDQPRDWQPWEVDLLQQVSGQLAIAIQQAEYYRQTQHFNAQLERQVRARTAELELSFELEAALKRITDKVRDSLDEAQILQTAVEELGRSLQVLCCNAALFDLDKQISTICYEYTTTLTSSIGRISPIDEFPELYLPLMNGEQLQFCSLLSRPGHNRLVMLCCPIQDENRVLGDLWLIKQAYHIFNEQDIRLVHQVANQCAIALRQARLYQAAQSQVQELERLNQLKDDFLSTVSHELRTPMSNIKMATQMLDIALTQQGILNTSHSRIDRYFDVLRNECQREISLINDLLDLARLDARTEPLTLHHIHLEHWLPQLASPFHDRMERQQQTLRFDIPPELPLFKTDESFVERIISELINNACKYTPAGEQITLAAQRLDRAFQLSVTNSGVEIPAPERDLVFDKFYRVPKNDPWQHGGTGLGLALVKRLVEKLNGTIIVTGAHNTTSFTLVLPDL